MSDAEAIALADALCPPKYQPALDAHKQVRKCLDDLRAHIEKITNKPLDRDVDNVTTLIETLTAAYMMPEPQTWRDMGLSLTKMERRIMTLLNTQRGRVFSNDAIANAMYYDKASGDQPYVKIVDVLLCRIRGKLVAAKSDSWIQTHWGEGYSLIYADAVLESAKLKLKKDGTPKRCRNAA